MQVIFLLIPGVLTVIAVFFIPDDRMPDTGKMRADLMRPPGNQPDFQKRYLFIRPERHVLRCNRLCVLIARICRRNRHFICLRILHKKTLQTLPFSECARDKAEIILVQAAAPQCLRHCLQPRQAFSGKQKTACIAVQTIADRGTEGLHFRFRKLSLLQEIGEKPLICRHILRAALLREQPRRFIKNQDIAVLVDDLLWRKRLCLSQGCGLRALLYGKFFICLVRYKNADAVALRRNLIPGSLFPVQRDILLAHHLIKKALRRLI